MLVGDWVDEKMIKTIWSWQFIEFYELLNAEDVGVYDVYKNEDGKKTMALNNRPKEDVATFEELLKAWDIYHIIYLKHPANRSKHQQIGDLLQEH